MRIDLHRNLTFEKIREKIRTLMIDYEISEAYFDADIDLNDVEVRPEFVRFYYFFPLGEPDFDYKQFERAIREEFHGQVQCGILYEDDTFLKKLRENSVRPF